MENTTGEVFVPILPLLDNGSVLALPDINASLGAYGKSLQSTLEWYIKGVYAPEHVQRLITQDEASIIIMCVHCADLLERCCAGVDYIEQMLYRQLVDAIGKEVQADDFNAFMRFHTKKIFGPAYAPKPFTYAVRRSDHYPDGIIEIASKPQPNQSMETMVRQVHGETCPPISIPTSAAT